MLFRLEIVVCGGALFIHLGTLALWWLRPDASSR
jgi:hypothetical protein